MKTLREAQECVLNEAHPLSSEEVRMLSALGRVVAEDIVADIDMPGFDRSAMDGFAVRSVDTRLATQGRPASLRVVLDLPAGQSTERTLGKGEAYRIMTGAPMPEGADCVVMVEETESKAEAVEIFRPHAPGSHVSLRGEDVSKGAIIIRRGKPLKPADLGILASLGRERVLVFRKPRVGIFSTGDELVSIAATPGPGQIRDSNSSTLHALVEEVGGLPTILGIVRDDRDALRAALRKASDCDIILFTGGVSVGDYDFVKEVLLSEGVALLFWKIAIKPGKPTFCGKKGGILVFGLPGYPVSTMLAFKELVEPAVRKMLSKEPIFAPRYRARLAGDVRRKPGRQGFIRARVEFAEGAYHATPLAMQHSGALSSMSQANALIVVPAEVGELACGTEVECELL